MIEKAVAELGEPGRALRQELDRLAQAGTPASDRRWLDLYVRACEQRRQQRLKTVLAKAPRIVFTKHRTIRPSFFAYTEGQSDAQAERHFLPGLGAVPAGDGRALRQGAHAGVGSHRAPSAIRRFRGTASGCCSRGRSRWTRTTTISTNWMWPPTRCARSRRAWALPITNRPTCPTATSSSPRRAACRRWIAGGRR